MSKLGMKQRASNEAWLEAAQNIEALVGRDELDALVEKTVADIREKTAGKTAAYAWSGGKSVQEIGKQLGMKPEEVFRLSDFSKEDFLAMMVKKNTYSTAEMFTTI